MADRDPSRARTAHARVCDCANQKKHRYFGSMSSVIRGTKTSTPWVPPPIQVEPSTGEIHPCKAWDGLRRSCPNYPVAPNAFLTRPGMRETTDCRNACSVYIGLTTGINPNFPQNKKFLAADFPQRSSVKWMRAVMRIYKRASMCDCGGRDVSYCVTRRCRMFTRSL